MTHVGWLALIHVHINCGRHVSLFPGDLGMNCVDRAIDNSNYKRSNSFKAEDYIRRGLIVGLFAASLCFSKIATAAWVDGFDTYTANVPMSNPGNGGPAMVRICC